MTSPYPVTAEVLGGDTWLFQWSCSSSKSWVRKFHYQSRLLSNSWLWILQALPQLMTIFWRIPKPKASSPRLWLGRPQLLDILAGRRAIGGRWAFGLLARECQRCSFELTRFSWSCGYWILPSPLAKKRMTRCDWQILDGGVASGGWGGGLEINKLPRRLAAKRKGAIANLR